MRWPLRNQIMLPLLAVALASLIAVGAVNAWLTGRQTRERIERRLNDVVGVLAKSTFPLTDAVLRQMRDLSSAEFALTDSAGTPLATSLHRVPNRLFAERRAASSDDALLGESFQVGGTAYFHTWTVLADRSGGAAARTLHVLFPENEYRRTWREAFIPSLIVGMAAVAVVAAVAHLLAGRISRVTARLASEVVRLARGDFAAVPLPTTDDEIRDLSLAVNRTAQMLADYERQVRRTERMQAVAMLGAGLAHEMRNAATGCRMALDLHAEGCRSAAGDESLVVAKRQLRLMDSRLKRFLDVDKAPAETVRREIDLTEAVDDVLSLVRPAAHHAHVQLEWRAPQQETIVSADEEELGQVIINLALNAVEASQQAHADAPRVVRVELNHADESTVELTVSDSGPGPRDSLTESLFDPFVTTKAEGLGLGLAIAKRVVESHHGTIRWSRTGGVTCFRVALPLATTKELSGV